MSIFKISKLVAELPLFLCVLTHVRYFLLLIPYKNFKLLLLFLLISLEAVLVKFYYPSEEAIKLLFFLNGFIFLVQFWAYIKIKKSREFPYTLYPFFSINTLQ